MVNNSNYSIDILVNGNSCKQYNHDGKLFIEAKDGSEYEIKINNNGCSRILAVSSVDSLNVLSGEPASSEDSGYVINGYDSLRIKGFRYNDEKVGAFKFASKKNSYAESKGEGKNVGVIGVRIFQEKVNSSYTITTNSHPVIDWSKPYTGTGTLRFRCGGAIGDGGMFLNSMNFLGDSSTTTDWDGDKDYSDNSQVSNYFCSMNSSAPTKGGNVLRSMNASSQPKGFDMGTSWGSSKESKVVDVKFERGINILNCDIYYASRESLIEMGVPLKSETKISFPDSFPKKYATPPANWVA